VDHTSLGASAHRDLHSFPTRRSSDLAAICLGTNSLWHQRSCGPYDDPLFAYWWHSRGLFARACDVWQAHRMGVGGTVGFVSACRSEEHTSELQSRDNRVCRLLLE